MAEATDVAADWNVIVTLPEATFREARKFLRRWGEVHRTGYFHVLTLTVDDIKGFLEEVTKAIEEKPGTFNILFHIIPAQRTFTFASAEEFEAKARDIAILWAPMLAGKSFHVRLHRRGFKGTLSTPKEQRFLDETLLDALETLGTPGRITFTDPDAILQIETIDGRAGVSLWQRDDLHRYPFLGVSESAPETFVVADLLPAVCKTIYDHKQ